MAKQEPAAQALAAKVQARLEPVTAALGLALEDVVVTPAGARRVLRVVLDAADDTASAPSLDLIAEASREISAALDADDTMGAQPYVLEVSSPGVDRPLTQPRHFARNVGRLVQLSLVDGGQLTGRVVAAGEQLELEVEGAKKGTTRKTSVAWDDVRRGTVQVEFRRQGDDAGSDEDGE